MPTYLDIGAARIQQWLARSSDLKGRRGASAMLSDATSQQRWQAALPSGAEWNTEAGDVDGVVSLVVDPGQARTVAATCLQWLRQELPAVTFDASWAEAETYLDAYPELSRARETGRSLQSLPPTAELPLAQQCQRCRESHAVGEVTLSNRETYLVCADCQARYEHAGDTRRPAPGLAAALSRTDRELPLPEDMDRLAAVGHAAADDAATRVALIYADGNNVGTFIRAAAHAREIPKSDIVTAINESTLAAFAKAADVAHDQTTWGFIPHIVGGDDLVVSTTARYAWPFLVTYLSAFNSEIASRTARWPVGVRQLLPTVSAGIVLHHHSYPLGEAIDLAFRAMGRAKIAPGPSCLYVDLDQDQPSVVSDPGRTPRALDWIQQREGGIRSLAERSPSVRKTMATQARIPDPAAALAGVRTTARKFAVLDDFGESINVLDDVRWMLQMAADTDLPGGAE